MKALEQREIELFKRICEKTVLNDKHLLETLIQILTDRGYIIVDVIKPLWIVGLNKILFEHGYECHHLSRIKI